VYALLAKPVHRYELILGKYLGLLFTLLVNVAVMTVGLQAALLYTGSIGVGGHLRVLPAVFLVFLSLALTTAIALFFSTFSTPALSALFTFFLWIIGHFGRDLQNFGALTKSSSVSWLCSILYYLLPNFANFSYIDSRSIIRNAGFAKTIDALAITGSACYTVGTAQRYCLLLSLSCAPGFQMSRVKVETNIPVRAPGQASAGSAGIESGGPGQILSAVFQLPGCEEDGVVTIACLLILRMRNPVLRRFDKADRAVIKPFDAPRHHDYADLI
jgi:hypothetical protein